MTTTTTERPSQRLAGFAVKHLAKMLAKLQAKHGHAGFDIYRDERTKTKEAFVTYLSATYSADDLDWASDEARKEYGGSNGRNKFRARVRPAVETTTATEAKADIPPVTVEAKPVAKPVDANDPLAAFRAMIDAMVQSQVAQQTQAIRSEMTKMAEELAKTVAVGITKVELVTPQIPEAKDIGIQHKNFPLLLKACAAINDDGTRMNVWLVGPPGAGKTRAAIECSKALDLKFYFNGAIQETYKLVGYKDANGAYHSTAFRHAWEHGGVYLFDEIDASNPNAVTELNAALSTGLYTFPDNPEPIARHKDCIVLAGANTAGQGGTAEFNSRMKQDSASLDRFVFVDWPVDEALERAIVSNPNWVSRVQTVRTRANASNIRGVTITPRASQFGAALLRAGIDQATVEAMVLRKGAKDDVWQKIGAR